MCRAGLPCLQPSDQARYMYHIAVQQMLGTRGHAGIPFAPFPPCPQLQVITQVGPPTRAHLLLVHQPGHTRVSAPAQPRPHRLEGAGSASPAPSSADGPGAAAGWGLSTADAAWLGGGAGSVCSGSQVVRPAAGRAGLRRDTSKEGGSPTTSSARHLHSGVAHAATTTGQTCAAAS